MGSSPKSLFTHPNQKDIHLQKDILNETRDVCKWNTYPRYV